LIPVAGELALVAPVNAQVNLLTAQLSAVVGFVVTTLAVQVPTPTFGVKFTEQVIVGFMLSVIVTVYEQVAVLFAASEAIYVTVVVPKLKVLVPTLLIPVAGELATVAPVNVQVNLVTAQLSAVIGFGVTTLAVQLPASTFAVIFAEQVIVGLILSTTVTDCVEVAVKPAPSVAVQVTVFGPFAKLAGERVTVTVVQLSEAVGAVNWELA
jgi:hypothetical protein